MYEKIYSEHANIMARFNPLTVCFLMQYVCHICNLKTLDFNYGQDLIILTAFSCFTNFSMQKLGGCITTLIQNCKITTICIFLLQPHSATCNSKDMWARVLQSLQTKNTTQQYPVHTM